MKIRKLTATILILCLLTAFCSCKKSSDDETTAAPADTDASSEDIFSDDLTVEEAAAQVAEAFTACDYDRMFELSTTVDNSSILQTQLMFIKSDSVFAYMLDNMSYEVDTLSADGNTINVTFTILDYADVFDSHYHEEPFEVVSDLQCVDKTVSFPVTMIFEEEDGTLKLSNLQELIDMVYGFTSPGYILTTDLHGDV